MVSNFVANKYYGLLMKIETLTNIGTIINFSKATGFNPNVVQGSETTEDEDAYTYVGTNKAYTMSNIVKMEVYDASTIRFYDNLNNYFACTKRVSICFIFASNTGSYSDISALAFLIESVLMIYDELNQKWVKVPHVASGGYSGTATTAVDSSRNAKARVIASVVRSDIAKAECKWNYLTTKQYSDLAKLFEPKYGGSFFVKACFFDSVAGGFDCSREFYCGDRKVTFARIKCDDNYMPIGYESVGLSLIER